MSFGELFTGGDKKETRGRKAKGARPSIVAPVKEMLQVTYALPMSLGYGEHWPLSDFEAQNFAVAIDRAAAQFPDKTFERLFKLLEKWAPVGTLAFVAYQINVPRIQLTQELIALRAQSARHAAAQAAQATPTTEAVN